MKIITLVSLLFVSLNVAKKIDNVELGLKGYHNDSIAGVAPLGNKPKISWCNHSITPLIIHSYTISPDDIEPGETITFTFDTTLNEIERVITETVRITGKKLRNRHNRIRLPSGLRHWSINPRSLTSVGSSPVESSLDHM